MRKTHNSVDEQLWKYLFIVGKGSRWRGSVFLFLVFCDDELTLTEEFQLLFFNIWLQSLVLNENLPLQLVWTWQGDSGLQLGKDDETTT